GVKVAAVRMGTTGRFRWGNEFHVDFAEPPEGLRAWLGPITSDAQGRFEVHGLAQDRAVGLQGVGDRSARQTMVVNPVGMERDYVRNNQRLGGGLSWTDAKPTKGRAEDFTWTLAPARVFEGAVTYADTGKPVPRARVLLYAGQDIYSL